MPGRSAGLVGPLLLSVGLLPGGGILVFHGLQFLPQAVLVLQDAPGVAPDVLQHQFLQGLLVEERVLQCIVRESMSDFMAALSDDEQALIRALFYEGITERALAEQWSLTHGAIHQRKLKLLEKLRALLKVE